MGNRSNPPRIYVVTSKCGKYAWVTASSRFEQRTLGKNAKVFCVMTHRVPSLHTFQKLEWEMRWHKAQGVSKNEFKQHMSAQLTQQGFTVIH